ncbi:MAG: Rrf2 family transcriptional regulator [Leptospiraceae bacterium]|nr:Rrf2 family transcriptional regulator [Leptospiraceae bacterium]MDW7976895.1 Rrf2 family transcriptional regulator [Leptospiraceae bacterium]
MLFSKRSNYGIQAVVFLYKFRDKKKFFKSKEIAEQLGIKPSYLTKILQDLVKEGILISTTGPEGGFAIPEESFHIDLLQVYKQLENKELLSQCAMGWKPCNSNNPCPLHELWNQAKMDIFENLSNITIKEASYRFWPKIEYVPT